MFRDDAQTEVVCGCRPSYNGSKPFCNENPAFFGDYYDKLRGKLVRPAALLRTFADVSSLRYNWLPSLASLRYNQLLILF